MSVTNRQPYFVALAALSAGAAAYHVAGVAGQIPSDGSPLWRHALFVAIDLLGAWYLIRRPIALLPAFVVVVCQQYLSHGSRAMRWWNEFARIDTLSIGTLVMLTVALVLLMLDARDRSTLVRRIVCPYPFEHGGGSV
jgi:hypothetical protein